MYLSTCTFSSLCHFNIKVSKEHSGSLNVRGVPSMIHDGRIEKVNLCWYCYMNTLGAIEVVFSWRIEIKGRSHCFRGVFGKAGISGVQS